jgi:hypothetical protein
MSLLQIVFHQHSLDPDIVRLTSVHVPQSCCEFMSSTANDSSTIVSLESIAARMRGPMSASDSITIDERASQQDAGTEVSERQQHN